MRDSGRTVANTGRGATRWVRVRSDLDAPPGRVYKAWSSPEELTRWFPYRVEGSLTPGSRSILVWPDQRIWWDVLTAEPDAGFSFRWPWLEDESYQTEVAVTILRRGYGSVVTIEDGPFDTSRPEILDAYAEACQGWAQAICLLRAQLDFSVDLRPQR